MILAAVDPGKNGAIAWYDQKHASNYGVKVEYLSDQPALIIQQLRKIRRARMLGTTCQVVLEKAPRYAGKPQAASRAFTFGWHVGMIHTALVACGFVIRATPTPQTWQKALGLHRAKNETNTQWKNRLKARAMELNPTLKVTLRNADALLILEYERRFL